MKRSLVQLLIGGCVLVALLYSYIDVQNQVTKLRLQIPLLSKEVKALEEENVHLSYAIDLFESPEHLLYLVSQASFAHLKHPMASEILFVAQGVPLEEKTEAFSKDLHVASSKVPLASLYIK